MSPIERVRAKAAARDTLGVTLNDDRTVIHAAWRKAAFELHPDRNDGSHLKFEQARQAYEFLCGESAKNSENVAPIRARRVEVNNRPTEIRSRVLELEDGVLDECRSLLSTMSDRAKLSAEKSDKVTPLRSADHVPASVNLRGRSVTFVVTEPLVAGVNRLALPTSLLEARTNVSVQLLTFASHEAGPGVVIVPQATRMEMFPGARDVRIQFLDASVERPPLQSAAN